MQTRSALLAAAVVALALTAGAAATNPPIGVAPIDDPGTTVAVTASSTRAGARPVALTLRLDTVTQCGRIPAQTIAVTLPQAAALPRWVAAGAVLANGRPVARVAVAGRTLTIRTAAVPGITCHIVADGTLRLVLTRAAHLGNPAAAGTYELVVRRGRMLYTGSYTVGG